MTRIDADWLRSGPVQAVLSMLTAGSYRAWCVGGCVRDALLGRAVSDVDVATDALPAQVIACAGAAGLRAIPTGVDHGTVTVVADGVPVEVTTLRRDVATNGRHAVVAFATDMAEDARRRDFTMNALYADADGRVSDPLDGLPDLRAGRIRFIGTPADRITEDYLRILRFFRFIAWYGDPVAGIDADGLAAVAAHVEGLQQISRERIGQEMRKLLSAPDPAPAVAAMAACGVLAQVLPGASSEPLAVLVHVEGQAGLQPDPLRRLLAMGATDLTNALRLSRAESRKVAALRTKGTPAELGYRLGADVAMDVLAIRAAGLGQHIDTKQAKLAHLASRQTFPVSAADLKDRHSGPALGRALKASEARWIASGFTLTREQLLD